MGQTPKDARKVATRNARRRNGNVSRETLRELCGLLTVSRLNAREARA